MSLTSRAICHRPTEGWRSIECATEKHACAVWSLVHEYFTDRERHSYTQEYTDKHTQTQRYICTHTNIQTHRRTVTPQKETNTRRHEHTQTLKGRTAGRLIETYEKVGRSESQGTEALYNTNTNTSAPQIQCEWKGRARSGGEKKGNGTMGQSTTADTLVHISTRGHFSWAANHKSSVVTTDTPLHNAPAVN